MKARPRVLVTGASGLLGGRLAELLRGGFEVVAARHQRPVPAGLEEVPLDILSESAIEGAVERARPDAIVHSAALADADACERDPARAERANVLASATLARLARRRGVRLVAISTDLVLGGDRPFAGEADPAAPVLTYGRTKLRGEEAVLAEDPGAAVARVALVAGRGYGARGSATEAIAWALAAGRRLRLFTDQFRTPVDPESVASAVASLLRGSQSGRLHLGGPERVSRWELGERVARALGLPGSLIEPARQADHPTPAPRPADVSLDSGRARRELGWEPRGLDAAIREGRSGPL